MSEGQASAGMANEFPEPFRSAVAALSTARFRAEVLCERMPAPQRIAPYASALSADVTYEDDEVATGRLVILHDPDGNPAWGGTTRCVAYARAAIEHDLAQDPAFAAAAWTWLEDALQTRGVRFTADSGTVTRVITESFGSMADDEVSAQVEIRASWTLQDLDEDPAALALHAEAWGELLCMAAGLEPLPDGVTSLPNRRGQRG